ncbi:hypothetical protein CDAR_107501 [Caerostris darwini]|uniref:Uncharacterized protein n=1 Tax=Caerostris darwini TaxID=1538125 RepID=A0AAV4RNT4_9ARAC|nr:hypothetical protein CDAR_107501 [Caerostris darwini]
MSRPSTAHLWGSGRGGPRGCYTSLNLVQPQQVLRPVNQAGKTKSGKFIVEQCQLMMPNHFASPGIYSISYQPTSAPFTPFVIVSNAHPLLQMGETPRQTSGPRGESGSGSYGWEMQLCRCTRY